MKKLLLLLLLGATVIAGGIAIPDWSHTAYLTVTTAGDTAQVMTLRCSTAVDSFPYKDSLIVGPGAACTTVVEWYSPLQKMAIVPGVEDGYTYACTVLFASTDQVGFEWTSPAANTDIDTVVDSLVHYFNNTSDLKDSVVASDSGTYVLVTSKFSMLTFDGRWSMICCDSTADTTSRVTSIAMVSDSMVATINADDSASKYLTAADAGTTFTLTSDDPGLAFVVIVGDSTQDTTHTQVNVTSWSGVTDTVKLCGLITEKMAAASVMADIVIDTTVDTGNGLGLSDSAYISLWTEFAGSYYTLAGCTCTSLPCTLQYRLPEDSTFSDTLLKNALYVWFRIADSASDTSRVVDYTINADYILKER